MKILASWPATSFIHAGVIETLSTVLLCYALAVINGHVPAWLPYISSCALYPPEKYVFRLGIVIGASFLAVQAVLIYYANRELRLAKVLFLLAVVSSASLSVVGVVNSKEDGTVHTFSAVLFFIGYDLYMILTLYVSWFKDQVSMPSFVIKCVLAVVGNVSLIGCLAGGYVIGKKSIPLAILEWANTFSIMFFLWSAVLDELKNVSISEILEDTIKTSGKNSLSEVKSKN